MEFTESLRKNYDFNQVYRIGKSCVNKYLVMYAAENGSIRNRLGISVSKKVGNSVVRHHLKRLIKESYRLSENHFAKGYDIVVVARVSAKDRNFHEIESALHHLAKIQKIYVEESDDHVERSSKEDTDRNDQVLS